MKWIREKYDHWCKETKRNGSVLVGGSIYEFFDWLEPESPSLSSEEEAVGFAEWIISIGYYKNLKSGKWYDPNERYPKYFSMNELYNLYLKQKQ